MTMAGPFWLAGTFAAVMLATSAYCVSRLVAARRWHRDTERDVDAVHVLMGVAMAGMLVPRLNPFWDGGWEVVFAIWTAWFAGQMIRASRHQGGAGHGPAHHVPHLLSSGAMLYMLLAVTSARAAGPAHGESMTPAGGTARLPALTLVLALAILGHVIWTTDRMTSLAPAGGAGPRIPVHVPAGPAANPAGPGRGTNGPAAGASTEPSASASTEPAAGASAPVPASLRASRPPISPRLAACCEIAMGVTMGYMLVLMV